MGTGKRGRFPFCPSFRAGALSCQQAALPAARDSALLIARATPWAKAGFCVAAQTCCFATGSAAQRGFARNDGVREVCARGLSLTLSLGREVLQFFAPLFFREMQGACLSSPLPQPSLTGTVSWIGDSNECKNSLRHRPGFNGNGGG
jgi:hypothetical protein